MKTRQAGHQAVWVAVALAITVAVVVLWSFAPVKEWLEFMADRINELGAWGPVVFALGYIIAVVALVPAAPLTIAAGLMFGLWALPLVIVAATVGATLAFLVARYLVRDAVHDYLSRSKRLHAIDQAIEDDGWKIVALLRLSPVVPFNLQNYLFGATAIRLKPYVLASFVGIMPGTLLYTYLGAAGKMAMSGHGGGTMQWTLFGVGLVATAAVAVLIARKAKAQLAEAGVRQEKKR